MIDDNEEWKDMDSVPRDGTPFVVQTTHTFRWSPYVDFGKTKAVIGKKAQIVKGQPGRWQYLDDRGHWQNTIEPKGHWKK